MYTTQTKNNKNSKTKLAKLPIFESDRDLQQFLERNLQDSLKQLIRVSVTSLVKTELESLRSELPAPPSLNGYYNRQLTSPYGRIEDVPIPRLREGFGPDTTPQTLGIFETEQERFCKIVEQMHLLGISQRNVKKLAKLCFGITISKDKVGAVHKALADSEEAQINSKPLGDDYQYLVADGIWVTIKGYGWESDKAVLLCVLGIKADGSRHILGFRVSQAEDEASWKTLLAELKTRGLTGKQLQLVIADDGAGLQAALPHVYPNVPVQLCIVHKMRNVLSKTPHKHKRAMADDLKHIFAATTKDDATARAKAVVKKWYMTQPKAMESLRFHVDRCFTYLDFPPEEWVKIRTSNVLEREFREVRRRLKVMDSTFHDEASAKRYANTIFSNLNGAYPRGLTH
jgi:transposase-like protein